MFTAERLAYAETNRFRGIVSDYLKGAEVLQDFYDFEPTVEGIRKAVEKRKTLPVNRELLADILLDQYKGIGKAGLVLSNIHSLRSSNTFTITTAHQPNLFTGPLYFVYKILHTIRLAGELKAQLPQNDFVPVFFMGSEDADLEELNHFYIEGKKYEWQTSQSGAVGRMIVDDQLLALPEQLRGQLSPHPFGKEWVDLLKQYYIRGERIQDAVFQLVHALFGHMGLVILTPDHPELKQQMKSVFEDDLFRNIPCRLVQETCERISVNYPVQARPRQVNLFYMRDGIRSRIERRGDDFHVVDTDLRFSMTEMQSELDHPGRFSPNVILRVLFQESILPDVAFVGGGGELAYWLQLKELCRHYGTMFPALILRNSFTVITRQWREKIARTSLRPAELFLPGHELQSLAVKRNSAHSLSLDGIFAGAEKIYENVMRQAAGVDPTLGRHVDALRQQAVKKLKGIERKMISAEKRRLADRQRQLAAITDHLFPGNGLQERIENTGTFYARWGRKFLDELFRHSAALEQQFTILLED